jgi:hypothetical protein
MKVRNAESSNFPITEYGYLIKYLLGNQSTFIGMYLNPSFSIQHFNKEYERIFNETFKNNKDPWENLLNQLYKIKETNSQDDHLLLQEALAKCMRQKVEKGLGKVNEDVMMSTLEHFKDHCIWGDTSTVICGLPHFHVLKDAKNKIEAQKAQKKIK